MTPRVAVLADDLTGAGDTAVQFIEAGWTAELRLHRGTSGAEVVAVTTDSRACSEADAATAVRESTRDLLDSGTRTLYKKIDSTLRGPLRAEIDAMLEVLAPGTIAVVCPAFPATGRTLVDGTLWVGNRPVAETAAGHDPVTPVPQSHLPTLLDAPLLTLDPARGPNDWARQARAAGRVVVVDAADEDDLDRIAALVTALGEDAVPVGSAGLAGPLARRWQGEEGTALVVVTTLHDASREQADALSASGAARHQPSEEQLRDDEAWSAFVGSVLATAAQRPPTLVLSAPDREGGVPAELVAARLADLTAEVRDAIAVTGLVLTGGDGARAILAGLGSSGLRLHGQVEPGVPLGTVAGGPAEGVPVATKAGGFGDRDVLIKAAEAVRRTRSRC